MEQRAAKKLESIYSAIFKSHVTIYQAALREKPNKKAARSDGGTTKTLLATRSVGHQSTSIIGESARLLPFIPFSCPQGILHFCVFAHSPEINLENLRYKT